MSNNNRGESSMVRVARWLLADVGSGAVFTKQELRQAFPEVGQVDRRMRDLRDFEWVIDTNREDASLRPDELRFVREGQPVWDGRAATRSISGSTRRNALLEAGFACGLCGTRAGQAFGDIPSRTASLSITVDTTSGSTVVACQLCRDLMSSGGESQVARRFRDLCAGLSVNERNRVQILQETEYLDPPAVRLAANLARVLPAQVVTAALDQPQV